jgi:hypothetical protein
MGTCECIVSEFVGRGGWREGALRYWSRPERVALWWRERLVVLDAEIAELLAVGKYARDPQHRRTLKRALGPG